MKRKEPVSEDVKIFEDVWYGPYLKYRWQEETGGPMYTVQMSLIPEEERNAAKTWEAVFDEGEDQSGAPWSSL